MRPLRPGHCRTRACSSLRRACRRARSAHDVRFAAMDDTTERTLLAALDTHPSDPAVRQVYGDWLEQHGYARLAAFVRGSDDPGVVEDSNLMWRAITSRARVVCDNQGCPGSWDRLESTDHCQVRGCRTCNECAVYCGSVNEA